MILDQYRDIFKPFKKTVHTTPLLNNPQNCAESHCNLAENFKFKSFFSTPNIINDLTDLSVKVVPLPGDKKDKMKYL